MCRGRRLASPSGRPPTGPRGWRAERSGRDESLGGRPHLARGALGRSPAPAHAPAAGPGRRPGQRRRGPTGRPRPPGRGAQTPCWWCDWPWLATSTVSVATTTSGRARRTRSPHPTRTRPTRRNGSGCTCTGGAPVCCAADARSPRPGSTTVSCVSGHAPSGRPRHPPAVRRRPGVAGDVPAAGRRPRGQPGRAAGRRPSGYRGRGDRAAAAGAVLLGRGARRGARGRAAVASRSAVHPGRRPAGPEGPWRHTLTRCRPAAPAEMMASISATSRAWAGTSSVQRLTVHGGGGHGPTVSRRAWVPV